jgi:adenylylsulfate kinase
MMGDDKLHFSETSSRSIIKGLGWRTVATLTTMTLVLIFTRELTLSLEVGALEVIAKLMLYYGYERIWNRVDWGRVPIASGEPDVQSKR